LRFIGIVGLMITALSCNASLAQNSLLNDYRKLTCSQLEQEGRAISKRGFTLSGMQAGPGGVDGSKTASAVVIVWPSTPLGGDRKRSDSLAAALRQMEAVEQASVESQCSIRFQRSPGS
jgi:hypothetical protein